MKNAKAKKIPAIPFQLEGVLLPHEAAGDKAPKTVRVATPGAVHEIRLSKTLRKTSGIQIQEGAKVVLSGKRKYGKKSAKPVFKANRLDFVCSEDCPGAIAEMASPDPHAPARIQICTKKNCWRKGGQDLWNRLQGELDKQPVQCPFVLESKSCLKRCKQAPCLRLTEKNQAQLPESVQALLNSFARL